MVAGAGHSTKALSNTLKNLKTDLKIALLSLAVVIHSFDTIITLKTVVSSRILTNYGF